MLWTPVRWWRISFRKLINSSTTLKGVRNSRRHTIQNCKITDRFTARTAPETQKSGYNYWWNSGDLSTSRRASRQFARRLEVLRNNAKMIVSKAYGGMHTDPAENIEKLVEKAVITEWRLNSTIKANVSGVEEVDRHGYGPLARKFRNTDLCNGAKGAIQAFTNAKPKAVTEKVTLCSYCPVHLWDVCEERRNTPWCEKCGQRGHDISMYRTFVNTYLTGNTRQKCLKLLVLSAIRM